MKKTVKTTLFGLIAVACVAAVNQAQADGFSLGIGLSEGGNFLSLGFQDGHGRRGPGGHGPYYPMHGRPAPVVVAPAPVVVAPVPVVVAPAPVVVAPAPVVVAPVPVVVAPAPVVVAAAPGGYWQDYETRVWIEGIWISSRDSFGRSCKQWRPGRWETRHDRRWVHR